MTPGAAGRRRRAALALAALLAPLAVLAACTDDEAPPRPAATAGSAGDSTGDSSGDRARAVPLSDARSHPVEDRVYPEVGDPGVDALHYDLDLSWSPDAETLTATETLVLRSTRRADHLQLDLAAPLRVTSLTLDGEDAAYDHDGKDLVVHAEVADDRRYTLRLEYAGRARPVPAPTTRSDLEALGWTVTDNGEVWTMQEPYGAYTWYAVNDQPSDKALYDISVSAPSPMVGVANGRLVSREEQDGRTVTAWHLDAPAASYLTTVAIGDYLLIGDRSDSGVPMSYWIPREVLGERPEMPQRLTAAGDELDWLEDRLGRYPFATLGIVLVPSRSGMETQTMLTLGADDYATSPAVLVHEMAHQWYGDQVTPADWRDVWMSEGMATYLQGAWQADHDGVALSSVLAPWAAAEPALRAQAGPPADFDPRSFGVSNVYYGPALMWDALRQRLGDDEFWRLVRAWPRTNAGGSAGYDDITAWWSRRSGQDLDGFFHRWLLSPRSPLQARVGAN